MKLHYHFTKIRYTTQSGLAHHLKTSHKGEKSHKCPECDMSFTKFYQLRDHLISVHDEQQPFYCPECPMKYKSNYALQYLDQI